MKIKIFLLFLSFFLLQVLQSCSNQNSKAFVKYALNTGLNIAEDSGIFKERVFKIKKYSKDTLLKYEGINYYLIKNEPDSIIIKIVPNRKNIQDTCLHYLNNLNNTNKSYE